MAEQPLGGRLNDAVRSGNTVRRRAGPKWRLVGPEPHEIICHNDWSPWNALFREGRYRLTLDWDLAGPGQRLWDIANAASCWVPLFAGATAVRDIDQRARRLRISAMPMTWETARP